MENTYTDYCTECNGNGQVQVFDSKHIVSCEVCNGLGYIEDQESPKPLTEGEKDRIASEGRFWGNF